MDSQMQQTIARSCGADLFGIADAGRLAEYGLLDAVRALWPEARSAIVVGRKILRGTLRGVEEGTSTWSTYEMFGHQWHEGQFLNRTIYLLGGSLEDQGVEALPLLGKGPLDLAKIAEAAGLGRIGKGGFLLTPEYGHRQRFGVILVDCELAPTPVKSVDFCTGCDACVAACPLHAFAGGSRDEALCRVCLNGRSEGSNEASDRYAAACGRACMVALENRIGEHFAAPFRKRAVWQRDIYGKAELVEAGKK